MVSEEQISAVKKAAHEQEVEICTVTKVIPNKKKRVEKYRFKDEVE